MAVRDVRPRVLFDACACVGIWKSSHYSLCAARRAYVRKRDRIAQCSVTTF